MKSSRYIVGIDLGTTNCAVAYIDTASISDELEELEVHIFSIPQISEPGQLVESEFLPSYTYIPSELEFPKKVLIFPGRRTWTLWLAGLLPGAGQRLLSGL